MINTKALSDVIDNDYKEFAMYVLENRAIPTYTDGFKNVHRKLVYGMLNVHKGKRTKVSDLGGISNLGYHHAESSAMSAVITLTAEWNNNVPLFKQHGSFGTRLIPAAAAPRYIFAELNQDFYKYFMDFDVCEYDEDDDDKPEPKTYLPIIPWVLVNGVEGIAIGFACRYLPHSPSDIAKHCLLELNGELKKSDILVPTFPHFNGEVIPESDVKYTTTGIVERVKRNTWVISELPWGYTRDKYFSILLKMEQDGLILDFEDESSKGFKFIIKVNTKQDKSIAKDPISYFKLSKSYTENYTALDENGELKIFESKNDIIKSFVEFRIKKIREQLDFDIKKTKSKLNWLEVKLQFSQDVIDDKIDFKSVTKLQLIKQCETNYNCSNEVAKKLVSIAIIDITKDSVSDLKKKINELKKLLKQQSSLDETEVFKDRLTEII